MNDEFLSRFRETPSPEFAAKLRQRLNFTALLLGGLLYGLFYPLVGLLLLLFAGSQSLWSIAWVDFIYLYPRSLLFSRPAPYLAISLSALGLSLGALWWGRPGKWTRWLLCAIVLSVIAYPFTAQYKPAVQALEGYTLLNATQPPFLLEPTKSAQIGAEIHRCGYTLLGWENETLYYEESCEGARVRWRYALSTGRASQVVTVPDDLSRDTAPRTDLAVSSENPYKIREAAGILNSPDGAWLAFVAQHSYGPEDVLLISATPHR